MLILTSETYETFIQLIEYEWSHWYAHHVNVDRLNKHIEKSTFKGLTYHATTGGDGYWGSLEGPEELINWLKLHL